MTRTFTIESEFVVPDTMERDNVEHVLERFYDDLRETDRFIDASVNVSGQMDTDERERLLTMIALLDDDAIEKSIESIEVIGDIDDGDN